MKKELYNKKVGYFKRMKLNGKAVAVTATGYQYRFYEDENGTIYTAYLEKKFGTMWYATESKTGLAINMVGDATRKALIAYIDENAERIADQTREACQRIEPVCDLKIYTEEEYELARREPEPEAEAEPAEVIEPADPETDEPAEHNESEPSDVSYYRFIGDFATCQTLEALKSTYLIEYGRHKDEKNIIAELTRAWGKHFDNVKCLHVNKTGKIYSTENRDKHEAVSDFPMLVELVSGLGDISISIEGTWTWITGNTKPHKEALKSLGFRWSPKRRAWCKLPAEKCA